MYTLFLLQYIRLLACSFVYQPGFLKNTRDTIHGVVSLDVRIKVLCGRSDNNIPVGAHTDQRPVDHHVNITCQHDRFFHTSSFCTDCTPPSIYSYSPAEIKMCFSTAV